MLPLRSSHELPLYQQLEQAIKAEISAGRWKPGEVIPSERDLTEMAGVSRATVRQAISSLARQGILTSVHGRGTYVAYPRYEQELHTVYSFSQQMRAQGIDLQDRLLHREVIPAPAAIADLLGAPAGERLIHIQRIRSVDSIPLMLNSSYIPYDLCPGLLTDEIGPSLYKLLTEKYDLPPLISRDVLESTSADPALAYHLRIQVNMPLMYIERVAFTHNHLPLQVGRTYIRGDMCRFRVDLNSDPARLELKPAFLQSEERW